MLEWLLLGAAVDLPHPCRTRIVALVEAAPGVTLTELRAAAGCSWGTIQHHTRVLERRGRLRSEPVGRSRRFFPATTPPGVLRRTALLRKGRVAELARAIRERPGCMQRDLTEGLHLTRKVLRGYVDDLVAQGLVVEHQHPRARTYHPTQVLRALLDELQTVPEPGDDAPGAALRAGVRDAVVPGPAIRS